MCWRCSSADSVTEHAPYPLPFCSQSQLLSQADYVLKDILLRRVIWTISCRLPSTRCSKRCRWISRLLSRRLPRADHARTRCCSSNFVMIFDPSAMTGGTSRTSYKVDVIYHVLVEFYRHRITHGRHVEQ